MRPSAASCTLLDRGIGCSLLCCNLQAAAPKNEGAAAEEEITRNAAISPNKDRAIAEKDFNSLEAKNEAPSCESFVVRPKAIAPKQESKRPPKNEGGQR